MVNNKIFSSKTNQWETPQKLFDELNAEFHFTLDPCADESNFKCKKYFTEKENGLLQDWSHDIVFCNPPYGRDISLWVEKAYTESIKGATVVMLIYARTDTRYFHKYIYNKAEIRFIKGRVKFGNSKMSAPFPSILVIYKNSK